MDVELRASDDDRHRTVTELQRHTAAGRLNLDEFSDRVAAVWTARTLGDLAALTRDLPASATTPRANGPDADGHGRRELLVLFAVAAATLVLLGLFMALTR